MILTSFKNVSLTLIVRSGFDFSISETNHFSLVMSSSKPLTNHPHHLYRSQDGRTINCPLGSESGMIDSSIGRVNHCVSVLVSAVALATRSREFWWAELLKELRREVRVCLAVGFKYLSPDCTFKLSKLHKKS